MALEETRFSEQAGRCVRVARRELNRQLNFPTLEEKRQLDTQPLAVLFACYLAMLTQMSKLALQPTGISLPPWLLLIPTQLAEPFEVAIDRRSEARRGNDCRLPPAAQGSFSRTVLATELGCD